MNVIFDYNMTIFFLHSCEHIVVMIRNILCREICYKNVYKRADCACKMK